MEFTSYNFKGIPLMLFLMFVFFFSSHAILSSNPSDTICNSTRFPYFCNRILPNIQYATIHDYGRYSIRHSLSITNTFMSLIDGLGFTFTERVNRAIQDCRELSITNQIFLSQSLQEVGSTATLPISVANNVQTLLSAILTNFQTCNDGLQEAGMYANTIRDVLTAPLYNGSMAYSVALALFVKGWCQHSSPNERWQSVLDDTLNRRKLLQTSNGGVKVIKEVFVNPNGRGDFKNITDAVAAAPNNMSSGAGYFVIHVAEGVYEEYVNIASKKRYIMMIGEGSKKTIITGNRSVVDGWTTFNSASFIVTGQGFVAINITFQNTAGATKHQAVAVRNGADLSTFYLCNIIGYQDTLYTHSLRQFYRECSISGTVDFIFGNAAVVLQNCIISARLPLSNQFNAITAQGRSDINQNTGISIQNCTIKPSLELESNKNNVQTFLGRPWKQYSRTVYMMSRMGGLIHSAGWKDWNGTFALDTLYYAEFNNTGAGADTKNRVKWPGYHVINANIASNFTVTNFINGHIWLPPTRVPFTLGLLS